MTNGIPIDVLKCLGDKQIECLTNLVNNILKTKKKKAKRTRLSI